MADFSGILKDPAFQAMLQRAADDLKARLEALEQMFPGAAERARRHEAGIYTAEEIESAKKRIAEDDYPPTAFGDWLRGEDQKMATSGDAHE